MKFNKCKCGCNNFKMTMAGKMECEECGKTFNPFSSMHYKCDLPDGKKKFWVIMTPHFIERWDEHFPNKSDEDLVEDCMKIQKLATKNKVQACVYGNRHIYWKMFWNKYRKRVELTMLSITRRNRMSTKFHKDVEFVKVVFNE